MGTARKHPGSVRTRARGRNARRRGRNARRRGRNTRTRRRNTRKRRNGGDGGWFGRKTGHNKLSNDQQVVFDNLTKDLASCMSKNASLEARVTQHQEVIEHYSNTIIPELRRKAAVVGAAYEKMT